MFWGYVGSQSLQYGAKTPFRHSPERHNFCRLTILRHSNIKMVAYKLSKNGWVMPFFVIFRLASEKLLVTVALDHPVGICTIYFSICFFVFLYLTASQYKGKYLCGASQKIIRSTGCKKIFFSLYHQRDEIHSFPAMYNTWGSSLGRNGSKK